MNITVILNIVQISLVFLFIEVFVLTWPRLLLYQLCLFALLLNYYRYYLNWQLD